MKRREDLEQKLVEFLYKWYRPIRIGDLKKELLKSQIKIPHSSLNSMILRLEKEGLLTWNKYGPVSLTENGQKKAAHQLRHFYLMVLFFMNTLKLSHDEAVKESIIISSFVSCELIKMIEKKLNFPNKCECEEIIPTAIECGYERLEGE